MRVENKEVKDYIINLAITRLDENCELFTKIFGKNFAKKQLLKNIDAVYTNETMQVKSAYYMYSEREQAIVIGCSSEESPVLTPIDIENKEELKVTCLHEAIHAILFRKPFKTIYNELDNSTGIFERYEYGSELGRGLNEGLTNWICKQAGLMTDSYLELTKAIEMLEVAIGAERVMSLGKGRINKNVKKQLGMDLKDVKKLLAIGDELYNISISIEKMHQITKTIEEDNGTEKLKYNTMYKNLINSMGYSRFLEDEGIEDNVKNKQKYIERMIDSVYTSKKETIDRLYEFIFDKYFKRDFEELSQMSAIPIERIKKLDDFYNLASTAQGTSKQLNDFKMGYKKLSSKCVESVCSQAEELYKNGNLSGRKLQELEELSNRGRFLVDKEFMSRIATVLSTDNPSAIYTLLCELGSKGDLQNINQYSILGLTAGNVKFSVFQKNGEIVPGLRNEINVVNRQDINNDLLFDFTLQEGEDEKQIINQFLNLKQEVEAKDPNAIIKILNRLIIVESQGKTNFYLITQGNLLHADKQAEEEIKVNLAPNEPQFPALKQESKVSEFMKSIRRKFSKNTPETTIYNVSNTDNKKVEFKRSIRDMSLYNEYIPETENEIIDKQDKVVDNEKEI